MIFSRILHSGAPKAASVFAAVLVGAVFGGTVTWLYLDGPGPQTEASGPAGPSITLPTLGGNVIAIVDGQPILRDAWEARLKDHPGADARRLLAAEARRLAVLVAARDAGFAEHPQVTARAEAAMVALYLEDALDTTLHEIELTERELRARLEAQPLTPPEPLRRIAVIRKDLASNEAEAARRALLDARDEVAGLELPIQHFGPLAQRYSDHGASRARGGVLGYLRPDHSEHDLLPKRVHEAAWGLTDPGAVSDVVEADGALYLVRYVDEHVPKGQDTESQVARLRERLLAEKRAAARVDFFARLEARAGVRIADDWKARDKPATAPVPPPGPGARSVVTVEASP